MRAGRFHRVVPRVGAAVPIALVLLLTRVGAAQAQVSSPAASAAPARVQGTVTDARGRPVAAVTVVALEARAGTVTDADGAYVLLLRPGTFTLRVTAPGARYQPAEVRGLRLGADSVRVQDVKLRARRADSVPVRPLAGRTHAAAGAP